MANIRFYREVVEPLVSAQDPAMAIDFLTEKGLLDKQMECKHCHRPMVKDRTKHRAKLRYTWRCSNWGHCAKFGTRASIANGSFFEGSKLSLQTWIRILYCWSEKISVKHTTRLTGLAQCSVSRAFKKIRHAVLYHFIDHPVYLGGPDIIVQCDESQFSFRPKHHRGRAPHSMRWVFGMVDCSCSPAVGWMEIVKRRDRRTLLPIIKDYVRAGSIVRTDGWAAYRDVSKIPGLRHQWVNHKKHFVDPETRVHTQAIESYWAKHKHAVKNMKGVKRSVMRLFLDECAWRDRYQSDAFNNICQHIANIWQF